MTASLILVGWGIVIGALLQEGSIRFLAWSDRHRTYVGDDPIDEYREVSS